MHPSVRRCRPNARVHSIERTRQSSLVPASPSRFGHPGLYEIRHYSDDWDPNGGTSKCARAGNWVLRLYAETAAVHPSGSKGIGCAFSVNLRDTERSRPPIKRAQDSRTRTRPAAGRRRGRPGRGGTVSFYIVRLRSCIRHSSRGARARCSMRARRRARAAARKRVPAGRVGPRRAFSAAQR